MPLPLKAEFEPLLHEALPDDEVAFLLDSLDWPAHTSVRINPAKCKGIQPDLILSALPWSENTFLLKKRPEFIADPALHSGYYYVQEASSSVVGTVVKSLLKNEEPSVVLDLCGAPGGKSTHISSVLRTNDILVANEVIHSRTPVLHENLNKWGDARHIVTRADSSQLGHCDQIFDIIVADMPCSGEGMFRKDPASRQEWSLDNVNLCALRQNRIASQIWPSLKPGGFLLYSTCTYNRKENEDNVKKICEELGAEIHIPENIAQYGFYSIEKGMYRLMPHRHPGEGFFFAVLRKTGGAVARKKHGKHSGKTRYQKTHLPFIYGDDMTWFSDADQVYGFRNNDTDNLFSLLQQLPAVYAPGTLVGKVLNKKNETVFKPESSLALISGLTTEYYPETEVNDSDIIRFFRREALINPQKLRGIHKVNWCGIKPGFVNGTGAVFNNLWPMEWRIRKEGLNPGTIVEL